MAAAASHAQYSRLAALGLHLYVLSPLKSRLRPLSLNGATVDRIQRELDAAAAADRRSCVRRRPYRLALAKNFVEKFRHCELQEPAASRNTVAGKTVPHESAQEHAAGAALYTDDLCARLPGLLHAWPVNGSPHAHARMLSLSTEAACEVKGVYAVLTAADVPGENDTGSNRHDEPLFPSEVMYHQQPVAWVSWRDAGGGARGSCRG